MYKQGFITEAEFDLLSFRSGTDSLLPSHNTRKPHGAKKGSGVKKQADVSFFYGEGAFPTLVCEVGFTESYIDLLEDARQWLEKSGGKVRLVMIIKLEEEKKSTIKSSAIDPISEEDNTRQALSEDDDSERDNEATGDTGEFGSDPASYEDLRVSCKTDDWVGPINGFLEIWRYDEVSGKMKQDGSRIVCFSMSNYQNLFADYRSMGQILLPSPTDTCNHIFPISKADIKGGQSTPEEEKQVFTLDLENYRWRLIKARSELAYTRMICYYKGLRKRKRTHEEDADSDSDFKSEEGSEEVRESGQEQGVRHTGRGIARVGDSAPGA